MARLCMGASADLGWRHEHRDRRGSFWRSLDPGQKPSRISWIAALVLAILGVYGVLAYSVSLRTPEFGIRIALGSSKVSLIRVVLLEALMPVGGGLALGLLASLAPTRAIRSLLYETSPADPASIVASVGILLAAMFVAAFLPAYRASRIDPIKVLRAE